MGAIIAPIVSMIPKVLLGILAKLMTEKLLSEVFTKVGIYVLEKLAANSKNKLDDELVQTVKERLES